jgi:preprotein translocase subunit SecB
MNNSPLQLSSCYFTEVKVSAQFNAKAEDLNRIDLDIGVNTFPASDASPRRWHIVLVVKIKPQEGATPPYIGEIQAFGTFNVGESWPEKQSEKLVYINGSGIVYAAVREMVCAITARSLWPMLTLPSWSFSQMYKEREEQKEKEALVKQQVEAQQAATAPSITPQ